MAVRHLLSEDADRHVLYTGQRHCHGVNAVRRVPVGTSSIPAATGDQALLEGKAFHALCWPETYLSHPLGIRVVHSRSNSLTLEIDPRVKHAESRARPPTRYLASTSSAGELDPVSRAP